jgi:hypothetical protein
MAESVESIGKRMSAMYKCVEMTKTERERRYKNGTLKILRKKEVVRILTSLTRQHLTERWRLL